MARPREFDRDRALDKATHLFWKQGYEATSVQDLREHLGLHPGSLYNTFRDKHSLFLEALDRYEATEGERTCQLLGAADAGRTAIRQLFLLVVEADANDPDRKGCLMVNSAVELAAHDPDVRRRAEASRERLVQLFRQAILQGQRRGEINARHDADALAQFLTNSRFGLRLTAKLVGEKATLLQVVETTLRALD